jgi:hypothetical protein
VDFLANDLSLHGQFHDFRDFGDAVRRMMEIRQEIRRFGSSLYCCRSMAQAHITAQVPMQQAVQGLSNEQRRALMQWLTQHGPHWEDVRLHIADDWIETRGEIVTDTAIGEAAFGRLNGTARDLVSFAPSDWTFTPVEATWRQEDNQSADVSIPNHWNIASITAWLASNPEIVESWASLEAQMRRVNTRLTLADGVFKSLGGHPFVPSAAERIRVLLHTLDRFKGCFNDQGQRNAEGHALYANHFSVQKGWFSDSSEAEKNEFHAELTFPHPQRPGETLFCPWHGKVKTPQIRIHFSWHVRADEPLYVVYVGPKRTKR